MTENIDWDDYEEVEKTKDEIELITVVNKKPSEVGIFNFLEIFTENQGVEFTNKNVVIYNDTNLTEEVKEISIKKIKALYLNSSRTQLCIKTKSPPNEIIYTSKAVECAKSILASRSEDFIPVYDLPAKSLAEFLDEKQLPSSDYICNETHNSSDSEGSEYSHPDEINALKSEDRPGKVSEESQRSTVGCTSDFSDFENSIQDEDKVYSENNRLDKVKSVCMITTDTLDSFKLLKVIGKGAFGRVFLAKSNRGEVFAMKRIRKDKVFQNNAVENILLERKILSEVNHPLLLSLKHVFSANYRIYFFCDFIIGGDLMRHLKKQPNGFSLSQVKFIASQLVLGFECLHEHSIVHRDLKPENVLIDEEGYIRLADFGLAKDLSDAPGEGSCGTLEYMAPEIIKHSETHNYEVDWWTLGILMYELYYKQTPFLANTRDEIIDNIQNKELLFPDDEEDDDNKNLNLFKNLIRKLLKKDPNKRLGRSRKNKGYKKVKKHPFFAKVRWSKILDKTYEPPYVPKIDAKKIRKYLKKKGCKIGVLRNDNEAYKDLGETDLPTKIKNVVNKHPSIFRST